MNILFLAKNLTFLGGVERFITTLGNYWGEKNSVFIYSLYGSNEFAYELNDKVRVILGKKDKKNKLNKYFEIYKDVEKIVKKNNIEIIIGENIETSSLAAIIGKKNNIISMGYEHLSYKKENLKGEILRSIFYKKLSYFVTASNIEIENYLKYKCQTTFIPNPLSFSVEEKANIDTDVILNIGRLDYVKGHDILIEAFKIVIEKYPKKILKIVGKDWGEKMKLMELLKKLDINKNVFLIEGSNKVSKYYQEASMFILPSREEGFSMVMLEAMEYGIPLIASNTIGPLYLTKNKENGLLFEKGNITALAEKIILLIEDKNLKRKIVQNGLLTAEKYSLENITKIWNERISRFSKEIAQ